MNLHTIHEPSQQTSDNTDPLIGEACQVNALLHIIETLQAQNEGLSTEQQRTIEELKGRVKDLTDKMDFLESELLAERQKIAEIQEQQEAQERARIQQERAHLEAARKATEEERKRLAQLKWEEDKKKIELRQELYRIERKHRDNYEMAKHMIEWMDDVSVGSSIMRTLEPYDDFMAPFYRGTQDGYTCFTSPEKGTERSCMKTFHIYKYSRFAIDTRFQYFKDHFQNAMNHYKNLYEETKSQREAIRL